MKVHCHQSDIAYSFSVFELEVFTTYIPPQSMTIFFNLTSG
jgi:hypothetical protein